MRKIRILAAVLAMVGTSAVQAQSSVQVYGLIDAAVEKVSNVNAAGNSLTAVPTNTGGIAPSRIGFRGTEDLGNGLKAIFTLENGFGPDSGVQNQSRLFGRQAWVGLSGGFGAVTVGRNYSMLSSSMADTDIIGPSLFSIGSIDSYLPNARSDNSIAYKGTFQAVTVGATYSLGRDASGVSAGPAATNCAGESATDSQACRGWSALARYQGGGWAVAAAYDTYNGGTGALAPFSPTNSAKSDTRWNVGGFVTVGPVKIAGGWLHRDNEGSALTPKTDLKYLGAAYNLTPALVIDGQAARLDTQNSSNDMNMYVLRATYNLSKRTAVYAMAAHGGNSGASAVSLSPGFTAAAGGAQNGILAGIKHSF